MNVYEVVGTIGMLVVALALVYLAWTAMKIPGEVGR